MQGYHGYYVKLLCVLLTCVMLSCSGREPAAPTPPAPPMDAAEIALQYREPCPPPEPPAKKEVAEPLPQDICSDFPEVNQRRTVGAYSFSLNGKEYQPGYDLIYGTDNEPDRGDVVFIDDYMMQLGPPGIYDYRIIEGQPEVLVRRMADGTCRVEGASFDSNPLTAKGYKKTFTQICPNSACHLKSLKIRWDKGMEALLPAYLPDNTCLDIEITSLRRNAPFNASVMPPGRKCLKIDISGSPVIVDVTALASQQQLEVLYYPSRPTDTIDTPENLFSNMKKLKLLDFFGGQSTVLRELRHAKNLISLDIGGSEDLFSIDFVKDMRELRFIDIWGTGVTDVSVLGTLPKLEKVYADNTYALQRLPKLPPPAHQQWRLFSSAVPQKELDRFATQEPEDIYTSNVLYNFSSTLKWLKGCDRLVVRKVEGSTCIHDSPRRVIADITSAAEIRTFLEGLHIVEPTGTYSYSHSGDIFFELYKDGSKYATIESRHTRCIHWNELWPGHADLTDSSAMSVATWLADHGYGEPLEEQKRHIAYKNIEHKRFDEFEDILPQKLRHQMAPLYYREILELLEQHFPDPVDLAVVYLRLIAKKDRPWSGDGQLISEILHFQLRYLSTKHQIEAIRRMIKTPEHLDGVIKWFFERHKWKSYDPEFLQEVLPVILETALKHPDEDQRFEALYSTRSMRHGWIAPVLRRFLMEQYPPENSSPKAAAAAADNRETSSPEAQEEQWSELEIVLVHLGYLGEIDLIPYIEKRLLTARGVRKEHLEKILEHFREAQSWITDIEDNKKDCARGIQPACSKAADMLRQSLYGHGTLAEALTLYESACKQKYWPACNNFAIMKLQRFSHKHNEPLAYQLFSEGCEAGNAKACSNAGMMKKLGIGTTQDFEKAEALLNRSCAAGRFFGCCALGYMTDPFQETVRGWTSRGILFDTTTGSPHTIICNRTGLSQRIKNTEPRFKKKMDEILEEQQKACDAGKLEDCRKLALWYLNASDDEDEREQAPKLLATACDSGDMTACELLGRVYEFGLISGPDPQKAMELYRRGCEGGHVPSCTRIAMQEQYRESGSDEARRKLEQACDKQSAPACARLGYMYTYGDGTEPDLSKAARYYTMACRRGSIPACSALQHLSRTSTKAVSPGAPKVRTNTTAMVHIPAGEFIMEHAKDFGRIVYLKDYYIDETPVTAGQYRQCVADGGCSPDGMDRQFTDGTVKENWACNFDKEGREQHPVNCISWDQADSYCRWAGKRLPTELEWEKAVRNPGCSLYPWGNEDYPTTFAQPGENPKQARSRIINAVIPLRSTNGKYFGTAPVKSFEGNKSFWGVWDVAGGVEEWTETFYTKGLCIPDMETAAQDDSNLWKMVVKSGRNLLDVKNKTGSYRSHHIRSERSKDLGFRCVADPAQ